MSGAGGNNTKRLIRQLNTKISQGEFYDAHQLVRAVFERFAKDADLSGAINFAEEYAATFAKHDQYELCVNLGQRVLALMKQLKEKVEPVTVQKLSALFTMCPPGSTESKYELMNSLILWIAESAKSNTRSSDLRKLEVDLHSQMADAYMAEKKYGACQNHLVLCDDTDRLLTLILAWQEAGYPSEKYLYTLRITLILLHRNLVDMAGEFLEKYADVGAVNLDEAECPPQIQLAYLCWAACKYKSLELYQMISRKYVLILRMDACVSRIFHMLEASVFNIKQEGSLMGMLSQMMGGGIPAGKSALLSR